MNREMFGSQDGPAVASVFDPGSEIEWLVVARGPGADRPGGGEVVSACCRIPHRYRLDGVSIPGSQIEFVTTDPELRGRGLVRALFAEHHRRAAEHGELLQLVGGIPYLYRKFGYGYGLDYPPTIVVERSSLPRPDPSLVDVRPATLADLDTLVALDTDDRRAVDGLTVTRDRSTWERWMARCAPPGRADLDDAGLRLDDVWEAVLLARRSDAAVGWIRLQVYVDEGQLHVLPGTVPDADVGVQLLARVGVVADRLGRDVLGRPVEVLAADRPGSAWARVLAATGRPRDEPSGIYARTPDELGLLRALEPVLSARLTSSGLARDRGEVVVSFYERAVRLAWSDGRLTAIEPAPADPEPFEHGGIGVAPDWFPALVLGRWGASELARRVDDVHLAGHSAVMDVLFPPRPNDLGADL
jgi:hypothetical protein